MLATNTSSISITEIAAVVQHPSAWSECAFFNPPTQMKLVEIIPGLSTSEASANQAAELAEQMGRRTIRVRETPGFVVNRVLIAMLNEAITLYEEGVASIEDIDEAMKLGAGMPLGPFKLADLVGLDVIEHAADVIHRELGRDKFHPPFTLRQHVRAGRLGVKPGWASTSTKQCAPLDQQHFSAAEVNRRGRFTRLGRHGAYTLFGSGLVT